MLEVYTDGGSSQKATETTLGYYGWAVLHPNKVYEGNGIDKGKTNNQMELRAVIEAITFCKEHGLIPEEGLKVHSDSRYVIMGISVWIHGWKKRDWCTCAYLENKGYKRETTIKNLAYWQQLDELVKDMKIEWVWVKGHNGNEWNERCDQLANEAKMAYYRKGK